MEQVVDGFPICASEGKGGWCEVNGERRWIVVSSGWLFMDKHRVGAVIKRGTRELVANEEILRFETEKERDEWARRMQRVPSGYAKKQNKRGVWQLRHFTLGRVVTYARKPGAPRLGSEPVKTLIREGKYLTIGRLKLQVVDEIEARAWEDRLKPKKRVCGKTLKVEGDVIEVDGTEYPFAKLTISDNPFRVTMGALQCEFDTRQDRDTWASALKELVPRRESDEVPPPRPALLHPDEKTAALPRPEFVPPPTS